MGLAVRHLSKARSRQWPRSLYIPFAAAVAIALPGALAVWTRRPLLFASLGPTAVLMVQEPHHPAADWYNALTGHALGILAACGVVWLLGLACVPSVFDQHEIGWTRVSAAVLSLGLAVTLENLAQVRHPPAASTTLLIALGSFRPNWRDSAMILIGVGAVTFGAEILKRLPAIKER